MKNLQVIVVLAAAAVLFTCSHSTTPGTSGAGPKITSISVQGALPASLITVTGTGFGSSGTVQVRFFDSTGYQIDVQALKSGPDSAIVSVPPYVIAGTEKFGPGTVSLQLIRNPGSNESKSNSIAGFQILDLPQPVASPGSVTLNLLNNLIDCYDTLLTKVTDTSTAGKGLKTAILANQTNLKSLALQVQGVVAGSTDFSLGSINGINLAIGSKDLLQTDRMILGTFMALRNAGTGQTSGGAKAQAAMCQQEANDYTDYLLSSAVENGSSDPRYYNYTNCVTSASVLAIPDAFNIVAGIGSAALGLMALGGVPEMAMALPGAALLYVKEMTAGIQIAIGAQLKNVNDPASCIALHNGISLAEDVVLDPIKSAVVSNVFSETAGSLKDIYDGLQSVKEAFDNAEPAASACTYALSSSGQAFDSIGGSGAVTVSTESGCAWTAEVDNVDWISVTNGAGSGTAVVGFSVQENTSTSQRSGSIFIAGKSFDITQTGRKGSTTTLPTGFPTNAPTGAYTVSVVITLDGSSSSGQSIALTNADTSAFAQALVTSMNAVTSPWLAACQQEECTCSGLSITCTPWNGTSFTMTGTIVATSAGNCIGGSALVVYTVTKN
jgi:hypothetical protein